MALRPGRTVRTVKRPYTRISKRKPKKSYVVGVPQPRITQFEMGNPKGNFNTKLWLISEREVQIRHNALEAARVILNKFLESKLGKENYFLKVLVYPHQVLREHSLATGAGADRFSSGMRKAFGRPKGTAAIVDKNQKLILVKVDKSKVDIAKLGLKRADSKLPTPCRIEVEQA
jgi:large subunit ribosomal protein L10e